MTVVRAFIGLGSNLDDPVRHVRDAIVALASLRNTSVVAYSTLYRSSPLGSPDQPDYINAVAAVDTSLGPIELLDEIFSIEQAHGRIRGPVRWGPRTLDLDLLLYGNIGMQSERLSLPHVGLTERNFVLVPLCEIAPDLVLPNGSRLALLAECCSKEGLQPLMG
jgi:2-amino-4-hydroxy-6-hydroxymethyldihydropteridine diphosphokinase